MKVCQQTGRYVEPVVGFKVVTIAVGVRLSAWRRLVGGSWWWSCTVVHLRLELVVQQNTIWGRRRYCMKFCQSAWFSVGPRVVFKIMTIADCERLAARRSPASEPRWKSCVAAQLAGQRTSTRFEPREKGRPCTTRQREVKKRCLISMQIVWIRVAEVVSDGVGVGEYVVFGRKE